MKTSIKYFQLIIVALMLYLTSCTDDGDAVSDPTKDNRDDYVGLWSVSEDSKIFGPSVYESEIIKNTSNSSNVAIDNFYQLGIEIVTQATVNGNQLFIPQQTITQKTLSGTGRLIDKSTIEFNFTVDDGADIDTVNTVYTKK